MARNGSGSFSRVAGTPYINNTTISETVVNAEMDDIASALTASIAKDGQTTPTANLPMATYRHTGVGQAAALTDYARYDQVQNSTAQWLTGVSGADTITASASPTPAAYYAGQTFRFVAAGANTTAVTLNVSGLGARNVTRDGTTALTSGNIASGQVVEVVYDGTQFQIIRTVVVLPVVNPPWTNQTAGATLVANSANRFATVGNTYSMPASPSDGDIVIIANTGTDVTNVIAPNGGQTIMGGGSMTFDTASVAITLKYITALTDWRLV